MTLLQICQDVADEVGVERPNTIIGNTNDTARRLLQAAKRTGQELSKKHYWTDLQRVHTFNIASGTSTYDLPSDFSRMIPYTQWDRSNEWRLLGPLSPQDWQFIKSGVAEEGPRRDYRLKFDSGDVKFTISPTPSADEAGETLAFEYISTQWLEDTNGDAKSDFTADSDVVRLDEELFLLGVKWRFLRAIGLEYLVEMDEFQHLLRVRKAGDGDMPRLRMDSHDRETALIANVQDANFPSS